MINQNFINHNKVVKDLDNLIMKPKIKGSKLDRIIEKYGNFCKEIITDGSLTTLVVYHRNKDICYTFKSK